MRREVDVAAIEDFQRVEQLPAEERGPARVPRQRRERRHGRAHAVEAAEVRFETPDRDDERRRDVVRRRDLVEQIAVLGQHLAPRGDGFCGDSLIEILLERLDDLGLRPVALDDEGARFVDAGEGAVDDFGADASGKGFGLDAREELGKRWARQLSLRRHQTRDEQRDQPHVAHYRRSIPGSTRTRSMARQGASPCLDSSLTCK